MTQQVRTSYRNHRKAAWGLALLLVAAIATVTIPFASGASSKTLRFVTQPPSLWQSSAPATTASVAVAVYSGGPNAVNSGPPPTPILTATQPDGGLGTINNFDVVGPTYDPTTKYWTWSSVTPKSSAPPPSGLYNFKATLGDLSATSNTFRVVQYICLPSGDSCDGTSNLDHVAPGKLKIANTLGSTILLDFQTGLNPVPAGCDNSTPERTWVRTFYGDPPVYFPAVALDFNENKGDMLQVTYAIPNSLWVLTNSARGNNDIEFCAVARHQTAKWNGDGSDPRPFVAKYGGVLHYATWDGTNYSGVLTTVSNPSKVKTDGTGSPAVCARGTQDISGETWRTWTVCIPYDWDWHMG